MTCDYCVLDLEKFCRFNKNRGALPKAFKVVISVSFAHTCMMVTKLFSLMAGFYHGLEH